MPVIIGLMFICGGVAFFYTGLKQQKLATIMEDTPLTKTNMISSFGPHKIKGTIEAQRTLDTPGTGEPCVWYHILIEEHQGKYHDVIRDEELGNPFLVRDEHGTFQVNPFGAEVDVQSMVSSNSKGLFQPVGLTGIKPSQDLTIRTLCEGQEVVVLGDVQPGKDGENCIGKGDGTIPFLISTKSEDELVSSGSFQALASLALGGVLIVGGIGMIVYFMSLT